MASEIRTLSPYEVDSLRHELDRAVREGREVRVSWHHGLMVKVGGGIWSTPMGEATGAPGEGA